MDETSDGACLLNESSPCKWGECVKSVKGIASATASPSDQWILEFLEGTRYGQMTIPNAFMKMWISSKSYIEYNPNLSFETLQPTLKYLYGLEYESEVYAKIVKPLLEYNICPHFVPYFVSGEECTIDDIEHFLPTDELMRNLRRNLYFIFHQEKNRPSISDSKKVQFDLGHPNYSSLTYSFLITKSMENTNVSTSITAHAFVLKQVNTIFEARSSKPPNMEKLLQAYSTIFLILFQVAYGCYAMYLSRTTHNDLHTGNVWITEGPEIYTKYKIEGQTYVFNKIKYCARIYDFDRAYSKQLGNNPVLGGGLCEQFSQCNKVHEHKDFLAFLSFCYTSMSKYWNILDDRMFDPENKMFDPILGSIEDNLYWKSVFEDNKGAYYDENDRPSKMRLEKLPSLPNILNILYRNYRKCTRQSFAELENVTYDEKVCHSNMFNNEGIINPKKIE
jgi:hypothetical protein